jgi:hypothetical protein
MPQGFIGGIAVTYLRAVNEALQEASNTLANNSSGLSFRNEPSPMQVTEGKSGSFSTGVGNKSNIVSDEHIYMQVGNRMIQSKERTNQNLYDIIKEIEELCNTSYILPQVQPRIESTLDALKQSLYESRDLTEQHAELLRTYARDIASVGGGEVGTQIDLAYNVSASVNVRQDWERTFRNQEQNMEDTIRLIEARIVQLEAEASAQFYYLGGRVRVGASNILEDHILLGLKE